MAKVHLPLLQVKLTAVAAEALKEKIVEDDEVFVITPATPYASSLDDLKINSLKGYLMLVWLNNMLL